MQGDRSAASGARMVLTAVAEGTEVQRTLETADLWEGAFLLVAGQARLVAVRWTANGVRTAHFLLEGEADLPALAQAYRSGIAAANLVQLRTALNHLRDALFASQRDEEMEGRRCIPRATRKPNGPTR